MFRIPKTATLKGTGVMLQGFMSECVNLESVSFDVTDDYVNLNQMIFQLGLFPQFMMIPKIGHQLAALRGKQPSSGIVQVGVVSFDTPLSLLKVTIVFIFYSWPTVV